LLLAFRALQILAYIAEEDIKFTPPSDPNIQIKSSPKSLSLMLADGKIPAMISPAPPSRSSRATSGFAAGSPITRMSNWIISGDRHFPDHACHNGETGNRR
jgi:hypothetical protein